MTVRELRRSVGADLAAAGELVAAVLPKLPGAGPSAAAEVTAEWLTRHVADSASGAAAQRVSPLDGTTGTTDRRRRVHTPYR